MKIRLADLADKVEIVDLYQRTQDFHKIPNPQVYPRDTLGDELYGRDAIHRYVATEAGRIIGHGLIEHPNPISVSIWEQGLPAKLSSRRLIEFGGAFVDPNPNYALKGVYSELLSYRLEVIRSLGTTPVSATWLQNEHIQRQFRSHGGREVGQQTIPAGTLCLFVF